MFAPRFYTQTEPGFSGLFRLIDEFDNYTSQQQQQPQSNGRRSRPHPHTHSNKRRAVQQIQTFTPRFDLRENEDDFELHGELPGIEKDQVHIEFTDPQTILIRGRVERSRTAGTPPAGLLEDDSDKMSGALPAGDEQQQSETSTAEKRRSSFHATVEDDVDEEGSTAAPTPATSTTEISRPVAEKQQQQQPRIKYWMTERSVGEFSRTFQFPTRVEHEGVSASLNNGVLTVVVPKAKKHESRRIAIN